MSPPDLTAEILIKVDNKYTAITVLKVCWARLTFCCTLTKNICKYQKKDHLSVEIIFQINTVAIEYFLCSTNCYVGLTNR